MSDNSHIKLEMFENRLRKVYRIRSKTARKQGISCYRLYDLDMPEFPFCIDYYEGRIYVAEYNRQHKLDDEQYKTWMQGSLEVIAKVLEVEKTNIFVKQRKVIEDRQEQYYKIADSSREFRVSEGGHHFIINLSDYLDTGLFLDHRITRSIVGNESKDKSVLNLFAYTGSFSVYAAAGGARHVTTVDLSNTYIQWARKNFEINDLPVNQHSFIVKDVLQWLKESNTPEYDIIVCDPPTFSNSKKMEGILDVQRDHVNLIKSCVRLLNKNGKLYFSTNFSKFKLRLEELADLKIKDITKQTTPFDFEGKLDRWCYLIERRDN